MEPYGSSKNLHEEGSLNNPIKKVLQVCQQINTADHAASGDLRQKYATPTRRVECATNVGDLQRSESMLNCLTQIWTSLETTLVYNKESCVIGVNFAFTSNTYNATAHAHKIAVPCGTLKL